jgi:hypothetical protein
MITKTMILLSSILVLISCINDKWLTRTDLEKYNLKGEVVFFKSHGHFIEFNQDGMITKEIYFDTLNNSYRESEFFYNGTDIIKLKKYKLVDNKIETEEFNYIYNSKNHLNRINKVNDSNDYSIVIYENDKVLETKHFIDSNISVTKYNYSSGRMESSINTRYQNNKAIEKYVNYYDKNMNRIKYQLNRGDTFEFNMEFKYDEFNCVIQEISRGENFTNESNYTYQFDSVGNWIEMYLNNSLYERRKIFYKGEDYSDLLNPILKYKNRFMKTNAATATESNR